MLKKRIIATLTVLDGIVVQSIGFKKYLPVGRPSVAVEFLNKWGIDEIVLTDISARRNQKNPSYETYKALSSKCYVPLAIGGGITSIEQIRCLLNSGADKVCINSYAIEHPEFITEAAEIFGDQCIIVAIDCQLGKDGNYYVFNHLTRRLTEILAIDWAKEAAKNGAGELFINSVDQDGAGTGFDIELNRMISDIVGIPVIACGGVGKPDHFLDVMTKTNVAAAAAGNYFHFTEHSVNTTKSYLKDKGVNVRLETFASYINNGISENNRLKKLDDEYRVKKILKKK